MRIDCSEMKNTPDILYLVIKYAKTDKQKCEMTFAKLGIFKVQSR